ncbi:MAG: sortase [Candidatus Dormibacteraeota bacterium]|nr:sortase [Candidatus Dormibacteraeota bacterium]
MPARALERPVAAEDDRSSLWMPLALVLVAAAALVGLVVVVVLALVSSSRSGSALPGNAQLPSWGAAIAIVVVAGVAVFGARALAGRRASATTVPSRSQGWRRLRDSRVIGIVLALLLVAGALNLYNSTPGSSADIRELPGEVNGLIQQTVAQPEQGYPRIRIKRVGIDLLLVKGDGKTPPVKYEAFTYPRADHLLTEQTPGNSYVYAHARTGMFWNLHDLNIGDTVEVDRGSNKVTRYRVSEIHRSVNWKDFTWLQPTSDDRVTLQTCNGWRDEDPRFIVVARRVPDSPTALAP